MTNRTRASIRDDDRPLTGAKPGQVVTTREILIKYLDYILPEVAAVNPTSAMLIDQAIARLIETPHGGEEVLLPGKLS